MTSDATISELQELCLKFRDERDWKQFHNPKDLALAMTIEVAEVLEYFRFKSNNEIAKEMEDQNKLTEIGFEVADVLYFVLLLAHELGIDLTRTFRKNLEKAAAKYPVHLSKGSNKKYTEL